MFYTSNVCMNMGQLSMWAPSVILVIFRTPAGNISMFCICHDTLV
jgi:hypothetical protein